MGGARINWDDLINKNKLGHFIHFGRCCNYETERGDKVKWRQMGSYRRGRHNAAFIDFFFWGFIFCCWPNQYAPQAIFRPPAHNLPACTYNHHVSDKESSSPPSLLADKLYALWRFSDISKSQYSHADWNVYLWKGAHSCFSFSFTVLQIVPLLLLA